MSNVCEACKHFLKYYYKDEFGRFIRMGLAGHCMHRSLTPKASDKVLKSGEDCPFCEPADQNRKLENKEILDKLRHAELLIADVKRILKLRLT